MGEFLPSVSKSYRMSGAKESEFYSHLQLSGYLNMAFLFSQKLKAFDQRNRLELTTEYGYFCQQCNPVSVVYTFVNKHFHRINTSTYIF